MFEIEADKATSSLRGSGIFITAATLCCGPDFALTLNRFGKASFDQIANAKGVRKLSANACIIEGVLFRGKPVVLGIYCDDSDYHSEFAIPDKFRHSLE
jgi:hypothetical protein